jgi:hypothetical protein
MPARTSTRILSIVRRVAQRIVAPGGSLFSASLCALAAHAVIYSSFWPSDGAHGYFGWYEAAIGGVGAAAVLVLTALVVASLVARGQEWTKWLHRLLPAPGPGAQLASRTVRLGRAAMALLFLQETLERSLSARQLTPATFSFSTWLLAILASAAFALLLVVAGRAGVRLIEHVIADGPRLALPRPPVASWLERRDEPRRRNPLADRRGLRAPPLLAG